ncbi:hypothetical protein Sango_1327500 [Sesamum angolense]|uniref:Uncharacterized protein n=1 Tax=Sesamum angolense TaxID=2727404 RepID=A0AAE1WS47_9LAMI|nr:hypothetical protein Sango_1327500 [Sesamum angolense]
MADYDFEPPSFSLGLDFDLHSEPHPTPPPDSLLRPAKRRPTAVNLRTIVEDSEDDFESPVRVSDSHVSDPPPALKRIRRGPTSQSRKMDSEGAPCNVDDEIEDFSSEEDWPRGNRPTNSVCSSSKPSLRGQGVVSFGSGSQWRSRKGKEISSASASANMETKGNNVIFPKLTVSPLRRFQLIDSDSDSDDPSMIEDTSKELRRATLSLNKQSDSSKYVALSNRETKESSVGKCQNDDLWKDFCSEKNSHILTPAFDEVCEEYFKNVKNKSKSEVDCKVSNNDRTLDVGPLPPAHSYFFHKDLRIQKLVRDRLPYFFPLEQEATKITSNKMYQGQFGHENNSRQTNKSQNVEKAPQEARKMSKSLRLTMHHKILRTGSTLKIVLDFQKMLATEGFMQLVNLLVTGIRVQMGTKFMWTRMGRSLLVELRTFTTGRSKITVFGIDLVNLVILVFDEFTLLLESGMGLKKSKKKTAAKKTTAAKKRSAPKKK